MKGCRPLSADEVDQVLQSFAGQCANRDRALFLLGVKSGFRVSELLSLRVADVVQGGKVGDAVTVQRRNMKKKVEGRTVPLHPHAKEALVAWLADLQQVPLTGPATFIFRSRKGLNKPISRVQAYRILKEAFATVELDGKTGTHSMRKTFANNVYRHFLDRRANGDAVDPFRLTSKALGHRNINSTDQYLSFMEEDIQDAILSV